MKDEKRPGEGQHNLIGLTFIINGKPVVVEKVNLNQPLKVAAEKALAESGNVGRNLSDYLIKYADHDLNLNEKVESFHFPENAKIFMSLKSAEGGNS
jgi:hypothetical protein